MEGGGEDEVDFEFGGYLELTAVPLQFALHVEGLASHGCCALATGSSPKRHNTSPLATGGVLWQRGEEGYQ